MTTNSDLPRQSLPPPEAQDFADAAQARRQGGAGRVLRRRMLRALIARVWGRHPSTIRFTREASGQPGIEGPGFISAAGCAVADTDWSAVALSTTPVGVDIEAGSPSDALRRWTLTEAYLKALGRGLSVAPERVSIEPVNDRSEDTAYWRLCLDRAKSGDGLLHLAGPIVAAVVWLV